MAHLGVVGTATANSSQSAVGITLTDDVAVDATLLIGCVWESAAGSVPTISSVADDAAGSDNSYTTTPDTSANAGTTVAVAVIRCRVTTALTAGDIITVTISGGTRSRWALQADAWDDVDSSPLDEVQSGSGNDDELSTGTTAATGQAREVVYAVFGFGGGRTVTVPDGWTGGAKVETSAGSGDRALQVIHKYVSATGTQEGTLTLSSSSTYAAAIATYTSTSLEPPEARISQVKFLAPNPGDALLARVSQVKLTIPQAVLGEVRISRATLKAPAADGQPPYSGIKAKRDGNLWDATIQTPD